MTRRALLALLTVVAVGLALRGVHAEPPQPFVARVFPAGGQQGTVVEVTVGGQALEGVVEARISGTGVTARVLPGENPSPAAPSAGRPSPATPAGTGASPSPATPAGTGASPSPATPAGTGASPSPSPGVPSPRPKATRPGNVERVVRLAITIRADAEPGLRDLRLVAPAGVSNAVRFAVGQLPEVQKSPGIASLGQAQRLPALPVLVNGQFMEGDRDFYRFTARGGQAIVCRVQARILEPYIADAVPGWNDPCLFVYNASGRLLQTVDDFRFDPDPVLVFKVPSDGDYVVEARDVLFRGRSDFVYRLGIGPIPFLSHVFPLGAQRGHPVRIGLSGANLPFDALDLPLPRERPLEPSLSGRERWGFEGFPARELHVRGPAAGGAGWSPWSNGRPFAVADLPSLTEVEPNDTPAQAQRVAPPLVVDGRIDSPSDVDCVMFNAVKGQTLVMEVHARRLGSPLDSILTLFGPKGRKLAENDDTVDPAEVLLSHHADSRIVHTFAEDGSYVLRLRDLQGKGGADYAYRLSIVEPQPDFVLGVTPDRVRAARGDSAVLTVQAIRRHNFNGPIKIELKGLPDRFVASPVTLGPGQDRTLVTVTVPSAARLGLVTPVVVGTARVGQRPVAREALPVEARMQAFSLRQWVPARELAMMVMATDGSGMTLVSPPSRPVEIAPGGQTSLELRVARPAGGNGAIGVRGNCASPGIRVRSTGFAADGNEATVVVEVGPKVPAGSQHLVVLSAVLRSAKDSVTRTLPGIPVRVVGGAGR